MHLGMIKQLSFAPQLGNVEPGCNNLLMVNSKLSLDAGLPQPDIQCNVLEIAVIEVTKERLFIQLLLLKCTQICD